MFWYCSFCKPCWNRAMWCICWINIWSKNNPESSVLFLRHLADNKGYYFVNEQQLLLLTLIRRQLFPCEVPRCPAEQLSNISETGVYAHYTLTVLCLTGNLSHPPHSRLQLLLIQPIAALWKAACELMNAQLLRPHRLTSWSSRLLISPRMLHITGLIEISINQLTIYWLPAHFYKVALCSSNVKD